MESVSILAKRRKPDVDSLSDKADNTLTDDSLMMQQLVDLERQIDSRIMRRMLAIQEAVRDPKEVVRVAASASLFSSEHHGSVSIDFTFFN